MIELIFVLSTSLSYNKDIKPMIEKHCSQCHNPNWPDKNWLDYETAKKNKDAIKLRVGNQTMPPGNITNMTQEERNKIIQWVNEGAQK